MRVRRVRRAGKAMAVCGGSGGGCIGGGFSARAVTAGGLYGEGYGCGRAVRRGLRLRAGCTARAATAGGLYGEGCGFKRAVAAGGLYGINCGCGRIVRRGLRLRTGYGCERATALRCTARTAAAGGLCDWAAAANTVRRRLRLRTGCATKSAAAGELYGESCGCRRAVKSDDEDDDIRPCERARGQPSNNMNQQYHVEATNQT